MLSNHISSKDWRKRVTHCAQDGRWWQMASSKALRGPPVDAAGAAGGEVGCISSSILVKSGHVYTCLGNTCFHGRCILKCCGIYDMSNTPQRPDKKCNHMWLRNFIWAKSKIPTVLGWTSPMVSSPSQSTLLRTNLPKLFQTSCLVAVEDTDSDDDVRTHVGVVGCGLCPAASCGWCLISWLMHILRNIRCQIHCQFHPIDPPWPTDQMLSGRP